MIEIQLERVRGIPWWRMLLTAPDRDAAVTMRFVARDLDPCHDGAVVAVGPTFVRPPRPTADAVPDGVGCPGMTDSLETLHEELAARGWRRDGHGEHPWSERFTRALVADS